MRLLAKTPPRKRSTKRTCGRLARALDTTGRLGMGCRGPCFKHTEGLALLHSSHPETHRKDKSRHHVQCCSYFESDFKLNSRQHQMHSVWHRLQRLWGLNVCGSRGPQSSISESSSSESSVVSVAPSGQAGGSVMSAMEGRELEADSDSCVRVIPHNQHIPKFLCVCFFRNYH